MVLKCEDLLIGMRGDPKWMIIYYLFLYVGIVRFVERLQENKFMIIGIDFPLPYDGDSQLSARGVFQEELEEEISLLFEKMASSKSADYYSEEFGININDCRVILVVPQVSDEEGENEEGENYINF